MSPTNSERRKGWKSRHTLPRSVPGSCSCAVQQAWQKLGAVKSSKNTPVLLIVIWILSLLILIIFIALIPTGILGINEKEPCQPDGKFSLIANSFNWWAYGGFFEITLRMGRLSFTTAKLIDVTWDLVREKVNPCTFNSGITKTTTDICMV